VTSLTNTPIDPIDDLCSHKGKVTSCKNLLIDEYKYFILYNLILRIRLWSSGLASASRSSRNIWYHSCTRLKWGCWRGQPLNTFTWFIGTGGSYVSRQGRRRVTELATQDADSGIRPGGLGGCLGRHGIYAADQLCRTSPIPSRPRFHALRSLRWYVAVHLVPRWPHWMSICIRYVCPVLPDSVLCCPRDTRQGVSSATRSSVSCMVYF